MMAPCFRQNYESQAVRVRDLCRLAGRTFGVEAVHDLRVEIKRLRAFFDLVESCNPLFAGADQFRPIRKLFKAAAPLRETQVDSSLARDKSAAMGLCLDEYRNELKEAEFRARKKFAAAAGSFDPDLFLEREMAIHRALGGIDLPGLQSKAEAYLRNLTGELLRLKQSGPQDRKTLHRVRILAKKTRYVLEVVQTCFRPDEAAFQGLNDSLRAVHQALGQWHDFQLGLASVQEFYNNKAIKPLADEPSYPGYARALQEDSALRLEAFEKAWGEFVRQAGT
jgi:CHAD domain-containing protein